MLPIDILRITSSLSNREEVTQFFIALNAIEADEVVGLEILNMIIQGIGCFDAQKCFANKLAELNDNDFTALIFNKANLLIEKQPDWFEVFIFTIVNSYPAWDVLETLAAKDVVTAKLIAIFLQDKFDEAFDSDNFKEKKRRFISNYLQAD